MDFSLTEDQIAYRKSATEFARQELDSPAPEARGFSRELWRKCAQFGIQGLPVPADYGGSDADVMTAMVAMEALGYGCRDNGLLFSLHAHLWAVVTPLLRFGTAEQKARWLPGLVDGTLVGAHGITEPDSGSDTFAMKTRAERRGDGYVLNGTKTFVTNAPVGDLFVVFATVNRSRGMWGVTGFAIPKRYARPVSGQAHRQDGAENVADERDRARRLRSAARRPARS